MTDRDPPAVEPDDDDPHGVGADLWHENPNGSYFDRFPPYATHYPNSPGEEAHDEEGEV